MTFTAGSVVHQKTISTAGSAEHLSWDESPTSGVVEYHVFRRSPQTGAVFDPDVDSPIAVVEGLGHVDEGLDVAGYDWQAFGRVEVEADETVWPESWGPVLVVSSASLSVEEVA